MDKNDADVPGNLGGLTSQNPDSAQEFRVLTNNFAPEYGRNNGAVIDVITRSGTNAFHGDTYYFGLLMRLTSALATFSITRLTR